MTIHPLLYKYILYIFDDLQKILLNDLKKKMITIIGYLFYTSIIDWCNLQTLIINSDKYCSYCGKLVDDS